jgi:glycosyltransferase involved in cell wall biosynthesis
LSEKNIKISIIIPVYNNADELKRCLDSLKFDIDGTYEIIVVDDCSPQKGDVIKAISEQAGARYFRQHVNAGPGAARNRGAEEAKGNILVFIDSDCVATPEWLIKITKPILEGRNVAVTSCYCGPVEAGWLTTFQDEDYRYRMPWAETETSFVNSCNFAIDKKTFHACGGFPAQRISEDMVLGMTLADRGTSTLFIPDAGIFHDYYKSLQSYLRQRYLFAFNTIKSFITRGSTRVKSGSRNIQSFNPLRTALGMMFNFISILSLLGTVSLWLMGSALSGLMGFIFIVSLFFEFLVHSRFIYYLTKRLGLKNGISYVPMIYIIDFVYILAVFIAILSIFREKLIKL